MNRPTLVRAVAVPDLRTPLRSAIDAISRLTSENTRLRAELAERDHHIATLRGMLETAYSGDTERPGAL